MNCPECDYKTKIQNKFEGHAVKNHPLSRTIFVNDIEESDKKEDLCGSKFAQHRSLSRHFQSFHKKKTSFQCSICDKVFGAKQTLERHLVSVHKYDPTKLKEKFDEKKKHFRCPICDKAFAAKQTLERHCANVHKHEHYLSTGKSFSEALILESVNPQYDKSCSLNQKKNTSSEYVVYKNCFFAFTFKTILQHNMF